MDGETDTVLSQEEKPQPESQPQETEAKRHNYENAGRRILNKAMRSRIAEMSAGLTDDEIQQVVKDTMSSMGYDPEDENNAKQAKVIAKMQSSIEGMKAKKVRDMRNGRVKESSTVLSETLKNLGYDPHSFEGRTIGQHLFNKYDVDDPDIFRDKEMIELEINELTSSLSKKKTTNPMKQEAIRKAASPQPAAESRSPDAATVRRSEDEEFAKRMGVSVTKAAKLRQLEAKLPSWMK